MSQINFIYRLYMQIRTYMIQQFIRYNIQYSLNDIFAMFGINLTPVTRAMQDHSSIRVQIYDTVSYSTILQVAFTRYKSYYLREKKYHPVNIRFLNERNTINNLFDTKLILLRQYTTLRVHFCKRFELYLVLVFRVAFVLFFIFKLYR